MSGNLAHSNLANLPKQAASERRASIEGKVAAILEQRAFPNKNNPRKLPSGKLLSNLLDFFIHSCSSFSASMGRNQKFASLLRSQAAACLAAHVKPPPALDTVLPHQLARLAGRFCFVFVFVLASKLGLELGLGLSAGAGVGFDGDSVAAAVVVVVVSASAANWLVAQTAATSSWR